MTSILTLVIASLFSFAGSPEAKKVNFIDSYVKVQEALAADSLEEARINVSELKKSVKVGASGLSESEVGKLELAATKMEGSKDIKEARGSFKSLSETIVKWVQTHKPKGFIVVSCSMASAKWVQKDGDIANPYYGSEMRECGEKL